MGHSGWSIAPSAIANQPQLRIALSIAIPPLIKGAGPLPVIRHAVADCCLDHENTALFLAGCGRVAAECGRCGGAVEKAHVEKYGREGNQRLVCRTAGRTG